MGTGHGLAAVPSRRVVVRVADAINVFLEERFWLCASLVVLWFLVNGILGDVLKKLWTDELYTLFMSQQSGPGEIVKATIQGADGAPPLYAMLVRAIRLLVGQDGLAVRLPSTLGYCGMILCLLAFCRRRLPASYSLLAVLLVCSISLRFLTEGRSYGLVMGCAGCALLCWQAAADGRRRMLAIPLLAVCLALMTALHYYALFFAVPLALAELIRWRNSGKLDIPVFLAMTPIPVVLALHYPLIVANKQTQAHFWAPATWLIIPGLYASYLKMCVPWALLVLFAKLPEDASAAQSADPATHLRKAEWVMLGAFSVMPIIVVGLSVYTTHVFVARYVLWAIPGMGVLASALLCMASRGKSVLVGVAALGLLVALTIPRDSVALLRRQVLTAGQASLQALASLPDGPEPIVIPDEHIFLELSYYAPLHIRERLICPLNRELDLRYFGYDTDFLLLSALSHRTKLHVTTYEALFAKHPRFVLDAPLNRDPSNGYDAWYLVKQGCHVVPIGESKYPVLFEVEAPVKGGETSGA